MKKQLHFLSQQLMKSPSVWGQTITGQENSTARMYEKVFAALNSCERLMAAFPYLNNKIRKSVDKLKIIQKSVIF
jgi:hypothetical protein